MSATEENNVAGQFIKEAHEGEMLYNYIVHNNLGIQELSRKLDVTRQAIYLQTKRPYLSSRFRKKLKFAGIELFAGNHSSHTPIVNGQQNTDTEKLLQEITRLQQIVALQAEHIKELGKLIANRKQEE